MSFDVQFAIELTPTILQGIGNTLFVTVVVSILAALLGFTWEILRRMSGVVRPVVQLFIDFIRSTPVLAQLYFLFFVLPYYGILLPATFVGIFGLSFYFSGYLSEVFKAGIDGIPKGQYEAGQALGLKTHHVIIFIIAPQMLRNIAAPMGSYSISILKSTPYLAIIAVPEMLGKAFDVASETYRYAEPMTVVGILFLALALVLVHLVRRLEDKLGVSQGH